MLHSCIRTISLFDQFIFASYPVLIPAREFADIFSQVKLIRTQNHKTVPFIALRINLHRGWASMSFGPWLYWSWHLLQQQGSLRDLPFSLLPSFRLWPGRCRFVFLNFSHARISSGDNLVCVLFWIVLTTRRCGSSIILTKARRNIKFEYSFRLRLVWHGGVRTRTSLRERQLRKISSTWSNHRPISWIRLLRDEAGQVIIRLRSLHYLPSPSSFAAPYFISHHA